MASFFLGFTSILIPSTHATGYSQSIHPSFTCSYSNIVSNSVPFSHTHGRYYSSSPRAHSRFQCLNVQQLTRK